MIIDALDNTIQIKIVYFGPAMSGKTTSLKSLFNHFGKKSEVESVESTVGRTLFFDYGLINFQNDNWKLKIHVYTTTGQDFYIVTRPVTLKAVDGLIFVADSQMEAYQRNIISWGELESYFGETLLKIPKVISFNKQDIGNKFPTSLFLKDIDFYLYGNSIRITKTVALNGEGILDSFEKVLSLLFRDLYGSQMILDLNYDY